MKSIKFLAALALPAMFAACTNDDLVAVQEDMQQNVELVGADLIGTGVSMKIGSGVESRLSGTAWSTTDKLGLGWIVAGSYNSAQTENGELKDNALYANHMFECIGNNVFKTKGNLFKGWHFGYFPFEYMEEIGKVKKVEINPTQTEEWISDRYNTALYLSPREFLTADDLDKDYQLKDHVVYQLYRSVNTIGVTINPSTMFTGSDVLKDLAVKEIKLDAGQGIFYRQANVSPVNLSRIQYDEDGNYDGDKDKEEFFKALPTAFDFTDISAYKSITTKVENSGINMSGAQTLRIHTLPLKKTLSAENVQFTIKVEGGKFTVDYATGDELSAEEEHNNAAIEAFVEACAEEGALTVFPGILLLDLQLTGDMFEADFTSIKSEEEWNKAVKIANALEMEEVEFTIAAADEEGNNWAFMDVDGDGNLINLPEGDLTVKGEKMILSAEGEWPTEGLTVDTDIDVNADLTVAGTMDVTKNNTITNKATIFAGAESSISSKDNSALDNAEGRVIVEYGAYVYPATDKEGVIAYEVENTTFADIKKINILISDQNKDGNAYVNTLIVKTVLDLNAQAVEGGTVGDRYNSVTTPNDFLSNLEEINIELEGGSLVHYLAGRNIAVKNVIAVNGTNTIDDVVVSENIETVKDAILNVNNTVVTKIAKPYFAEEIINNGTLNSNVATLNVNKVDNHAGTINVASDKYIYYADEYVQGGTANGWILKAAAASNTEEVKESDLKKEGSKYTVYTALGLKKLAEDLKSNYKEANVEVIIANDIDMSGVNWTTGLHFWNSERPAKIDGNGKTIKNLTGSQGLVSINDNTVSIENLTIDGASIYAETNFVGALAGKLYGNVKNVTVKNVEIAANENLVLIRYGAMIGMHNSGNAENCTVEKSKVIGAYHNIGGIAGTYNETNGRTYSNCVVKDSYFSSRINHSYVGAITGNVNGVTLTLENCSSVNTTPSNLYGNGEDYVTIKND